MKKFLESLQYDVESLKLAVQVSVIAAAFAAGLAVLILGATGAFH